MYGITNTREIIEPPKTDTPKQVGGGMKFDGGKLRYDLLPDREMDQLAGILTFGAAKYAENSWQTIPNARNRYLAALRRHISKYRQGEPLDNESGLPHLAHAAVNALFLLWFCNEDMNAVDGGK